MKSDNEKLKMKLTHKPWSFKWARLPAPLQRLAFAAGSFSILIFTFSIPVSVYAHEVYVLDPAQINYGISAPPFDLWQTLIDNLDQTIFWAFIGFVLVSTVFCISIFRRFETKFAGFFDLIRDFAAPVARVTVGIGFIASGYHAASFGPELPFAAAFGSLSSIVAILFIATGILMTLGMFPRLTASAAVALFAATVYHYGVYMLTYINYLGEAVVLFLIGAHNLSLQKLLGLRDKTLSGVEHLKPLAFPLLRVTFGVSLIYSSLYAKILHNNLALQVAGVPLAGHLHPLAYYFGFEPHFMVLGAALIEITLGLFYILGIEIRWTSIFLLFWLTLSLLYFGESVWPHIVLIGIPIAFILHGYDKYSIEGYFFKKDGREPVL